MQQKKNNTLVIVLIIVAIVGVCCCGGGIIAMNAGVGAVGKINQANSDQITSFLNRASAANWDVNAVSDQIYSADNNAQRPEFTQIVFNELAKLGSVSSVSGNSTGFTNNTVNGVNTQTFSWSGTVTLTNGSSPISFEMIKVGETWQVKDIYLR